MRRAGLKGLRLSAITVVANTKRAECREALQRCLADKDENIRRRARMSAERLEGTVVAAAPEADGVG